MDNKLCLPERRFLDFDSNHIDVCSYGPNWSYHMYIKMFCMIGATLLPSANSVHDSIYAYFGITDSKQIGATLLSSANSVHDSIYAYFGITDWKQIKYFLIFFLVSNRPVLQWVQQSMVLMCLIYLWSTKVTNQPVLQAVNQSNRVQLHAETFLSTVNETNFEHFWNSKLFPALCSNNYVKKSS